MSRYQTDELSSDVTDDAAGARFTTLDNDINLNNNNNIINTPQLSYEPSDPDSNTDTIQQVRVITVNKQIQEVKYCSNSISTSKYNIFTFLPKFLFEQFSKYSNIFFFMIVLLQV